MQCLAEIRDNISALDRQLLELLSKRKKLSLAVAQAKIDNPKAIRDQQREQQLLIKHIHQGRELGLDAHYVTQIFHTVIEDSVLAQQAYLQTLSNPELSAEQLKIAFLGQKGSYSNIATHRYFSRYKKPIIEQGCSSFQGIVDQVEGGHADFGVLPIENTSSGSINDVYDVMQQTSLSIVGELSISIDHCILTKNAQSLDQVKVIYAHPQPHQQCSKFLQTIAGVKFEFVDSSSHAMEIVAQSDDPSIAAMGSLSGGEMYGLSSLASNIANQQQNFTRFIIVCKNSVEVADQVPATTTFIMSTNQQAGSLVEALLVLKQHDINMSKLESRPVQGNPWEEMFYVDVSANLRSAQMQAALTELSRLTRYIKVLGCYPSENVDPTLIPIDLLTETTEPTKHKPDAVQALSGDLASREHKSSQTVIQVGDVRFGSNQFVTLAGPSMVESESQIQTSAQLIKEAGAAILSSACHRPSQMAYGFQGLGDQGLEFLQQAGKRFKLPVLCQVTYQEQVSSIAAKADMLYVKADQMNDRQLLRELGRTTRPIILERDQIASIDEWLDAANFILAEGNQQVILCESGIKTFDGHNKTTLDLAAIPLLKARTHLPIIINPSDSCEDLASLSLISQAAKALGAQGLILNVDLELESSKVPSPNALNRQSFEQLMHQLY